LGCITVIVPGDDVLDQVMTGDPPRISALAAPAGHLTGCKAPTADGHLRSVWLTPSFIQIIISSS
jgi:hypothetical protein